MYPIRCFEVSNFEVRLRSNFWDMINVEFVIRGKLELKDIIVSK